MDLVDKIFFVYIIAVVIISLLFMCIKISYPYIKARKYPKTIDFKDIKFVEEGKEIEINTVSGQTEFIDFKTYEKEYEKSKTKGYININGLFVNINNIESTTLCKRGAAYYKDLKLSYTIYGGEIEMRKSIRGGTIFYTLRNEKFNKTII